MKTNTLHFILLTQEFIILHCGKFEGPYSKYVAINVDIDYSSAHPVEQKPNIESLVIRKYISTVLSRWV